MADWIERIPPWFWVTLVVHVAVLGTVAYLILLERKVAAWVQDRIGPNRVGPRGLLQPMADGLKFLLKEEFRPGGVDKVLFTLAPAIMILVVLISIAVIPWGGIHGRVTQLDVPAGQTPAAAVAPLLPRHHEIVYTSYRDVENRPVRLDPYQPLSEPRTLFISHGWQFQIANLNIGVLYVLAVLSLAVYGVVIGGWASNNKYSFLGGLRATANMISYEIPLGLSILVIVVMFGTLDLARIVERQTHYWGGIIPAWNVFSQPLAFIMFLVCIHAEANRAPFDTAEAEQELVGGYHTEYSSMRFALFFLSEYAGMVTTSAVCVALFFGGWHLPWIDLLPVFRPPLGAGTAALTTELWINVLRAAVFFGKTVLVLFLFMWVRWSLPRFRFDQIMGLAWRALIPISLALVMATAVVVYMISGRSFYGLTSMDALMFVGMNLAMIIAIPLVSLLMPAAPPTNRRVRVEGSRFESATLPPAAAMLNP
jgi:NADH-quinone oxidoreductase subunit H